MANRYLLPVYRDLFNEDFTYSEFEHRLKMQKGMYLLQELGVPVGDYRFSWYKHGPYSQSLMDDAHAASPSNSINELSSISYDCEQNMLKLKSVLAKYKKTAYPMDIWAECLASLHYLKKDVFSQNSTEEFVLGELVRRKVHLDDSASNLEAYNCIQELFA